MSLEASINFSFDLEQIATFAPSETSASATALPMPVLEAVTIATLFF